MPSPTVAVPFYNPSCRALFASGMSRNLESVVLSGLGLDEGHPWPEAQARGVCLSGSLKLGLGKGVVRLWFRQVPWVSFLPQFGSGMGGAPWTQPLSCLPPAPQAGAAVALGGGEGAGCSVKFGGQPRDQKCFKPPISSTYVVEQKYGMSRSRDLIAVPHH